MIALLLLVGLWVLLARGVYRRKWTGESHRIFEREWEIKIDKQTFYFSVPSFKSAYFDIRPTNFISKLHVRTLKALKIDHPTALETHFRTLVEDPKLAQILSDRIAILDGLVTLRELGQFRLISTGNELHGQLKFKSKIGDDFIESPEFQKITEALAHLIEAQFDLPLNEMKPKEIVGWRRSATLPLAMMGAGLVLLLIRPFLVTSDLMLEPRAFKVWLGLSLFATGLGLLWSSMRVPPHYFTRTALAYGLMFSWSAFFWLHGIFTSVNRSFATTRFVIECQIQPESEGRHCQDPETKVTFQIPSGISKPGDSSLKFEAELGWLGQVFFVTSNPGAPTEVLELTTEAPVPQGEVPADAAETSSDESNMDEAAVDSADPFADVGDSENAPPVTLDGLPEMGSDAGSQALDQTEILDAPPGDAGQESELPTEATSIPESL